MRYFPLLLANLLRKKIRTGLTIGSFAVALLLFGVLAVVHGAFYGGLDVTIADRLIVINKVSLIQPLPLSYKERLLRIPGVKDVTYATWFGGVYQNERNFIPILAVDLATYRSVFPEFVISEEEWKAFEQDREGAAVGEKTAQRFGWKVGDRVPIQGSIFAGNWEFNIRGIYRGKRVEHDTTMFWFQWRYLDERKEFQKGMVGWYVLRVASPDDAVRVVREIDSTFANSPWETKTETEKAWAASWIQQIGNIEFLILSIGSVVFFTLLLVTGNTMGIAVRERIRELAVLKAVGYSDVSLLLLVLAESLVIAAVGGGLGLALAKLFSLRGDPTGGLLPFFYLPRDAILTGFALALAIGGISGLTPALTAMRLRVVDALRRV